MDLGTIATVVAICASAFGVFVALDQVTLTTRQRRLAEFLKSVSGAEPAESPQERVLQSLRWEMVARLVGASAIPAWTMAGDVATLGGVGYSSFLVAKWILEQPLPTDAWGWVWLTWPYLLLLLASWSFLGSLIRRIDERRRIADDFLDGKLPLVPAKNYELHGFKMTNDSLQALWFSLGLLAITFGVALLVVDPKSSWALMPFGPGFVLITNSCRNLRLHFARRRGAIWLHPLPVKAEPSTPTSAEPAAARDVAAKRLARRRK